MDTRSPVRRRPVLFVLFISLTTNFATGAEKTPPRPNIVLILCDDLGYADVGFNGAKDIRTPALDRLAKAGTVFSSAYVCHPFCGPSRMGLMTGRYPHSFGAPYNLPPAGLGIEQYNREGVPTSETLIGSVLQNAGYYTGAIGKWHMGINPQFHPNVRGFDDFYGFLGGGHMYFPEKYESIYERQKAKGVPDFNEYIVPLEHNGRQVRETEYLTDALSREAVRFVNEAAMKNRPFFLYLAYNAPHTPLEAKEDDLAEFAHIADEKRRTYAAMVYAVDRGVGQLVNALRAGGMLENTLIVFLSDNGGKLDAGADNGPLREGKGSVCEGGVRVPMFMHWPAVVSPAGRFDHPVTALDFYPTFARLAGAEIPRDKQLDGVDIWDAFIEGRSPREGKPLFSLRHWNGFHHVGVRKDEWKITRLGPNSPWNLFHLADDIGESRDVSAEHPQLVRDLVAEARRWSESHVEPRWFDNLNAAKAWHDAGMPDYERTFQVDTDRGAVPAPYGDILKDRPGAWVFRADFSDEFDASHVDRSKWNIDTKDFGPWSWQPENVTQQNGALRLQMVRQEHQRGGQQLHYTSGMARIDKTITYGYFEAKVKGCSRYPGACPAFWLYSIEPEKHFTASDGETVAYSEIDVVELQQCEFNFETKQHFPVTRIDCNLHATLMRNEKRVWVRPHSHPDLCRNHFDSPWDPRDDYHVYGVENSRDWIVWYIDGKEVARKPNVYWHLPMHVTLSLGLRHPFVAYKDGERYAVAEATTDDGFPTAMSVDYVRVWQRSDASTRTPDTDWSRDEYIAREKAKWAENGWRWNQAKVESNFAEIDTNGDGVVSGRERQLWFAKKSGEMK